MSDDKSLRPTIMQAKTFFYWAKTFFYVRKIEVEEKSKKVNWQKNSREKENIALLVSFYF